MQILQLLFLRNFFLSFISQWLLYNKCIKSVLFSILLLESCRISFHDLFEFFKFFTSTNMHSNFELYNSSERLSIKISFQYLDNKFFEVNSSNLNIYLGAFCWHHRIILLAKLIIFVIRKH